jgi:hypothetical protein
MFRKKIFLLRTCFFLTGDSANEVTQVLRKYEKKGLQKTVRLSETKSSFRGTYQLEKIAAEKGVMPGALKEVLAERLALAEDYVLLENYVLGQKFLKSIDHELEKLGAACTYADAVKIFQGFGLDGSLYYPVLEHLGYKVIWTGLSEENAKVKKA